MGDIKAINELKRVVKAGGHIIFVTPIGKKPVIEFNAHRIYTHKQILKYFIGYELVEFSLIPEYEAKGGIIINASEDDTLDEHYACGCFLFKRI